jgi:hypothetical protein
MCVKRRRREAGGGDTESKTRTPHKDVGKKTKYDKQNSLSSLQASSSSNIVHTKAPTHTISFHFSSFLSLSLLSL